MICDHATRIDIRKVPRQLRPLFHGLLFEGARFETTRTETAFGGQRDWFLCPKCKRRCAIIYREGYAPRWGCRLCLKGRYRSEHMSPRDRRLHAAFKVRDRLGQTKGGIFVRFPSKPKGMHWQTYEQIRLAALHRESEILLQVRADLFGISIDQARDSFS
jgi:hypothetical protein